MNDPAVVGSASQFQEKEKELLGQQRWDELVGLYEARHEQLASDTAKEQMLFKAGEVALDRLGALDRARDLFLAAFKVRRTFLPALGALKTLCQDTGDRSTLEQVIGFELEIAKEPRRRATLYSELGKTLREARPELALEAYLNAIRAHPKSRQALEAVEALARDLQKWPQLAEAYRTLAEATSGKQNAVYHFLAGTVHDERLKDAEGAAREFGQALEAGPEDPRIVGTITSFFERTQAWDAVVRALYQHLELAETPAERGRILKRLAQVHETCLDQPDRAQKLLLRAVDVRPGDKTLIKHLFQVSDKRGDPRGKARALELEADLPGLTDKDRGEKLERAAEERDKAGDGRKAQAAIRRSLQLRPRHPRALKLFERITRRLGDWREHAKVLAQERELLDPSRSAQEEKATLTILRRLAEVCETRLKDDRRAAEALDEVVVLDPGDAGALERLESLARRSESWPQVARVLERRVEAAGEGDDVAPLLRELAEVRRDRLEDGPGAIAALRRLVDRAPDDVEAWRALGDLLQQEGEHAGRAEVLARLARVEATPAERSRALRRLAALQLKELDAPSDAARSLERALETESGGEAGLAAWKLLAKVARTLADDALLQKALAGWRGLEEDPAALRLIRIELAGIAERQGDLAGALSALEEILAEAPADPAALPAISRLLRHEGRLEEAAQHLEAASLVLEHEPPRAAALCRELAELYEGDLRDRARARDAWRRALVHEPDHADTYARFVALSRVTKAGKVLFETLDQVCDRVQDDELRVRMWRRLAELAEGEVERPAKAALLLERVLEQVPGDADATRRLRALYRALERWGDLADLLERAAAEPVEDLPADDCRRELAEVARARLDDQPRAARALEALVEGGAPADDPAWDELAGVYRDLEQHDDLVRVLELAAGAAEGESDADPQVARLAEAATVLEERLGRHADAAAVYDRALALRPRDLDLLRGLARVRRAAGQLEEAAGALERAAGTAADAGQAEAAAGLWLELAELQRRGLVDPAAAEASLTAAIAQDESYRPAHDALLDLLAHQGVWDRLELALDRATKAAKDEVDHALLLVRRGELLGEHDRLDEALATLDRAEEVRPRLAAIRDARIRALRPAKLPAELADALRDRRQALPDELTPERTLDLMREEAELRGFALGELEPARKLLLEAHDRAPRSPATLKALLRVERRLHLTDPLADHLVAAAELEPKQTRQADLLIEAGRVLKTRGQSPERARKLLEKALQADPARIEAVRWLATIAREARDRKALVRWTEREAELEEDAPRRAVLLARLAGLQRRGHPKLARQNYERALRDDPENLTALRGLAPLLARQKAWKDLEQDLQTLSGVEPDRRLRLERLVSLGDVRLQHLKDVEGARSAYGQALEINPAELRALRGRALTFSAQDTPAELVETLTRQLEATPKADDRLAIGKRVARLQYERLEDHEAAVGTLEEVLRLRPRDEEAWKLLREVYTDCRRWERLADAYEREGRVSPDARLQEERFRQAALIHHHHLDDKARAAGLYREILLRGDPHCVAVASLPALLLELGEEQAYEDALVRIARIVPNTRRAADALIALARREAARGEREAAILHFEAALAESADAIEALDELCKLHMKDVPRLVEVLDRKRRLLEGRPEAIRLRVQRALLLETKLDDLPAAAADLRAAAAAAGDLGGDDEAQVARRSILERLTSILRRCERWTELAEALGQRAELAPEPGAAAELLVRRGEVERHELGDPRAAIASYEAAFSRRQQLAALQPLVELYRSEELWAELAQALQDQAPLIADAAERASALAEAAGVLDERLGRLEDAVSAWEAVLDLQPDRDDAFRALAGLTERTGDRRAQARALEREIESLRAREGTEAAERLAACALAAARLHEEQKLSDRAIALLEVARERDPLHDEVFRELDGLYADRGEDRQRYLLYERRAAASADRAEVAGLHERMAELAEAALGQPDDALDHWEEVLRRQAGHEAAIDALKRLHAERGAWTDVVRIRRAELEHLGERAAAGDPESAGPMAERYLELGGVLEERLEELDEAVAAFSEAHARDDRDPRPLRGLERIHLAREAWPEVVRVRLALREQETDPKRRSQLALEVADAHERLGARDDAIAALQEALQEVPDNAAVLALLRRYLLEEERWEEASAILAREADVARERAAQFEARLKRAEVLRDRLDARREAAVEFERARELAPHSKTPLLALAELYEQAGERERLVEVLEARAVLEEDDADAADLYEVAGDLDREPDPEAACRSFERALRRDPLRPAPLDALIELSERLERWSELARSLHRRADLARASDEDPTELLRRAAAVEEQRLGDRPLAAASLDALVEVSPEDRDALAELARLRGVLGEQAARAAVLGRLADLAAGADRRHLLLERAEILAEELDRPAAAAECVQGALDTLADRGEEARDLAGRLLTHREAAADPRGVLAAAEQALRSARDRSDEEALLRRVGELTAGPVYDPDRAIEVYRELNRRHPDDDAAREALEAVYKREARHEDLVAFLGAEIERLDAEHGADERVAALRHQQAELYRGPLQNAPAAERAYRRILEEDADDDAARDALLTLYRVQGDAPKLASLLAEKAERAKTDLEAAEALVDEAAVYQEEGRRKRAIDRLRKALDRAEGDPALAVRTHRSLVHLYRAEGDFEALARTLEALARREHLDPSERAAAWCELGVVYVRQLDRADDAVGAFEEALGLDPGNVPSARALAELYEQRGDRERLVATWEREAAAKVDKGRRVWLGNRIGAARHELGDAEAASRAYQEALELDPSSVQALRGLVAVTRELGDYHTLAKALEQLSELSPSPVDRLEARRELAHISEEALGDVERAVGCYRGVLADAPDDVDAVRGLARGLRALGDTAGLTETLEHELELTQEADRRRLLALEATGHREELAAEAPPDQKSRHLERALTLSQTACELAPADAEALQTYARVAEKLGRWREQADATVRLARGVDDASRAGWMLRRAAKVRALRLGDTQGAIDAYREAVELNPADRQAWEALEPLAEQVEDHELYRRVVEKLIQLAEKGHAQAELALKLGRHHARQGDYPPAIDAFGLAREKGKGPLLEQALEALDGCYRKTERWAELALVLRQRVSLVKVPAKARDLLLERAKILEERLGRPDRAVRVLSAIRKKRPDDVQVAREMERLLSLQRRWEDLAAFYEAEAAYRGSRGYDALVLLGRLRRDRLEDPEGAADALQRAVTLNPSGLEAVESLGELYVRTERWSRLLDTLRLQIGLVKGRTREQLLRRAGHLAEEKLGDLVTAVRYYQEAVAQSPQDRNLLGDLGRVQEARGDFAGLIETLGKELELVTKERQRVVLFKRIGQIYADKLFRPLDALAAYRQALALDAADEDALAAVTTLLRDLAEWAELESIIERRLEKARGQEAVTLRLELAQIKAERRGNPAGAIDAAEEALTADPRCLEAARLMVTVLRGWDDPSRDARFASALKKLAALQEGTPRADALVELADLLTGLGKGDSALGAVKEAFRADPVHEEALGRLTRLQAEAGLWDDLVATYETAVDHAATDFRRAEVLTRLAEVLETHKQEPARAEARYRESLRLASTHLPALRGLARSLRKQAGLLEDPARATEVAELEEKVATLEPDPAAKAEAFVRAGDVRREALEEFPAAMRNFREALRSVPNHFQALASLGELAHAQDDFVAAQAYLQRVASSPELVSDPERAAELLLAQADCLKRGRKLEAAAASLRAALEYRPTHLAALDELADLYRATGAWPAARDVLERLVEETRPPLIRAEYALLLAEARAKLGEDEAAIDLYREGLAVLPNRGEAHLALADLLRTRDAAEARRRYEFALKGSDDGDRAKARLALAEQCEVVFKEREAAAGHLQAALEIEGDHQAGAAKRLAEILGRQERWSDAIHNLKRAIELESDRKKQAELHANLARVMRDRLQDRALARRCFEWAFELNPDDRHTLESLLRLLDAEGDLHAQVRYLGRAAEVARRAGAGDEAALRLRTAELFMRLRRLEDAAREYEAVLALEPAHSGAQAALSQLYLSLGEIGELERIQRQLLGHDPLNVKSYRALADGWKAAGRGEEHGQALQVLAVLRGANEAEERAAEEAVQRAPQPQRTLKDDDFERALLHPRCRGPLFELVSAAGHLIGKQLPDDLRSHGIGWMTKPAGIEGNVFPEHYLLKQVCDFLGITRLDVYWMAEWKRPEPIIGHGRNPSLLLCPAVFQNMAEPEKAFVLARALGPLRANLEPFLALAPDQARKLVLGVLKGFDPSRRFDAENERPVRNVTKAVSRAGADLQGVGPVAEALWRARTRIDFGAFQEGIRLTASRCGLLAAGGMLPAARAVVATNLSLRGRIPERTEDVAKEFREIPELCDMLAYGVTDDYLRLRRRLFSIPTTRKV